MQPSRFLCFRVRVGATCVYEAFRADLSDSADVPTRSWIVVSIDAITLFIYELRDLVFELNELRHAP